MQGKNAPGFGNEFLFKGPVYPDRNICTAVNIFIFYVISGNRTHILKEKCFFISENMTKSNGITTVVTFYFLFVIASVFRYLGRKGNHPV